MKDYEKLVLFSTLFVSLHLLHVSVCILELGKHLIIRALHATFSEAWRINSLLLLYIANKCALLCLLRLTLGRGYHIWQDCLLKCFISPQTL